MDYVSRTGWGAPATSPAAYIASTRGVKVHYLGALYSSRAHSGCDDKVREVRAAHLNPPTENYSDIAYNLVVCEHGTVFEGRGVHKKTGANGNSSLNTAHYAVLGLLGSSGMTEPTGEMLHGLRDAIEHLRAKGEAGNEIKGHKDGYATACPGGPLYAWVRAGAPRPEEDDVTPEDIAKVADAVVDLLTGPRRKDLAAAAWRTDNVVDSPDPEGTNPFWFAQSYLIEGYKADQDIKAKLEALAVGGVDLDALAEKVATHPTLVDRLAAAFADVYAARMKE